MPVWLFLLKFQKPGHKSELLLLKMVFILDSNYYGFDTLNENPTKNQAARAANVTWGALLFRRLIERQEVSPFAIAPRTKVPFW